MIAADFIFAFVMVISVGIFMFALTFSLATIEVAQYIVWSTARNYSAGQISEMVARDNAEKKYGKLIAQFPLLTNSEDTSAWFELSKPSEIFIGELDSIDTVFMNTISAGDKLNDGRQPWTGVSSNINLKLFSGLEIPFLGKVALDKNSFQFPIRAFLIRNVSESECKLFFNGSNTGTSRFSDGIMKLEDSQLAPAAWGPIRGQCDAGFCGEDNGC